MKADLKQYDIGGCDFVSSHLSGQVGRATAMKNMTTYPNGAKGTRPGSKVHAMLANKCFGLCVYENPTSGDELIVVSGTYLQRVNESAFTVTYGGAGTPTVEVIVESNTWKFKLYVNGSVVLNYDMGKGYDESSIKTLTNLKTAVDAVSGFSSSVGFSGAIPAAFLEQTINGAFTSGSASIKYWYLSNIPQYTDSAGAFANADSAVNSSTLTLARSANINNTLWISAPFCKTWKYDGVSLYSPQVHTYRTGLSANSALLESINIIGGSLSLTTTTVMVTYRTIDRQRNFYETDPSEPLTIGPLSLDAFEVSVGVGPTSPYDSFTMLRNAYPTSNQTGVTTIAVDNGAGGSQQLLVGDYAYFLDRSTSTYVERRVTAATNTTITIAGAAVNVNNNDVISNNVRVVVWRTKDGGTIFYKAGEYPIGRLTSLQTLPANEVADSALTEQYQAPIADAEHNNYVNSVNQWPPAASAGATSYVGWEFIVTHQGLVVVGGANEHAKIIRWSDLDAPEYFPLANYLLIEGSSSDLMTGSISLGGALVVLRQRSIHVISGDLLTGRLRGDPISKTFGCVSGATLKEIEPDTYLFLSERGLEKLDASLTVTEVSQRISPVFSFRPTTATSRFVLSRAVAVVDKLNMKYILFLPVESTTSSQRHPTSSSRVFEYDYRTGEIWEWDWNVNMAAGAVYYNGELWWASRVYSSFDSALQFKLNRRIPGTDDYIAVDHVNSILTEYDGQWEHGGSPALQKQISKHTVHSLDQTLTPNSTITVEFYKDFGEIAGAVTSASVALSSAVRSKTIDPKPLSFRAWKTKYSHNTLYKRLLLSGFENEVDAITDEVAAR